MKLRVARHTNDLDRISIFYQSIFGFEEFGSFEDHNDYNGVFLRLDSEDWHLEFTSSQDPVIHQPDEDDILVFYPNTQIEYNSILERIESNHIHLITAKNPYWQDNGIMIKDPDGFGIVISDQLINKT